MSPNQCIPFWLPVPGYEGSYEMDLFGSLRRVGRGLGVQSGRIKKPTRHPCGYVVYSLSLGDQSRSFLAHRLMAETWIGPIPDGYEVNHKNGIKTDNRLENLEIVTRVENQRHAVRTGLRTSRPAAKIDARTVAKIRAAYVPRVAGYRTVAAKLGLSSSIVRGVIAGRTWRDHGPQEKRAADVPSRDQGCGLAGTLPFGDLG